MKDKYNYKLTALQVHCIRVLAESGLATQKAIGEAYGITQSMVSLIKNNYRHTTVV